MSLDLAAAVRGLRALPLPVAVLLGLAAAVHGLCALPLPAAVLLGLANLRGLFALPAAVCGLPALPAAVLLGLADLGNTCWHAQLQVPLPRTLWHLCALNLK